MTSIAIEPDKPKLRGVLHQFAFFAALVAGAVLVATTPDPTRRWGVAAFAVSLCWLYAVSAFYHRVNWTPSVRMIVRRIDHASIFLLIGGTYTPICLLGLVLTLVWSGAALGFFVSILWVKKPKQVTAAMYLAVGWLVIAYAGPLGRSLDDTSLGLFIGGGVLYSLGALAYALKRPNPFPAVFGYHEVFHLLVIIASAVHFAAIVRLAH
jgi:hemolysin III